MDLACAVTAMEEHLGKFRAGFFDDILNSQQADPALQLETVLELIVVRLGVDYTSPRFLEHGSSARQARSQLYRDQAPVRTRGAMRYRICGTTGPTGRAGEPDPNNNGRAT